MNHHCKKCNTNLPIQNLSPERKVDLWKIRDQEGAVHAIKSLFDSDNFSLVEAKTIVLHITPEAGKCGRCGNDNLVEFEVECDQCNSLNLNWASAESADPG